MRHAGRCMCVLSILIAGVCWGETLPSTIAPYLHPDDDAFMTRQAEALLGEVGQTLRDVPPKLPEPRERRLALRLIDAVLHEPHAPNRVPVQQFYHQRIAGAVEAMESTVVNEGAVVWKLYNHGFVVRTASVTLAFDINPGPPAFAVYEGDAKVRVPSPGFPIEPALLARLVRQCDVLFISHKHGDHAVESVARLFLEQKKPVVAPPEVFEGADSHGALTHLERNGAISQTLQVPGRSVALEVVVYPGQQYQGSGIPNNVVLVTTPEGISVMHNGDQINDPYPEYQEDFRWSDTIHEQHTVDILMTNCWMNDLFRFVKGVDPKLVLPGHENEVGHVLWDRVPYWGDAAYLKLNYPELLASDYPVLVMTWGESYHYRPAAPESNE